MIVEILGTGPAAAAAALALHRLGIASRRIGHPRQTLPPIVLQQEAIALMVDLAGDPNLFTGAHPLRRRIVHWGGGAPQVVLDPALTLPAATLRRRFATMVAARLPGSEPGAASWTLDARPGPQPRSGERIMLSTDIILTRGADPSEYWIEAAPGGWVLLAPRSAHRATLQAALPAPPSGDRRAALLALVASTQYVARRVAASEAPVALYPIAPMLRRPLVGPGWLAIGGAAIAFDPLCGDGTAQAIRSGLLAAAVIAAPEPAAASGHFEHRLQRSFEAHLLGCAAWYGAAPFSSAWRQELGRMRPPLPGGAAEMAFELRGLRLEDRRKRAVLF